MSRFLVAAALAALLILPACKGDTHTKTAAAETGQSGKTLKTSSGIEITFEKIGTGPQPKPSDVVKVDYEGRFTNGQVFDSSIARGVPAHFPLNRVIPCWTEALQHLHVGGKARIVCPPDTAYGVRGAPPTIPPNATLIFQVSLLGIQ